MPNHLTLVGLGYSPWTLKARWSLAHCKIPHRYKDHLILVGMPELYWRLRIRAQRPSELTVPALLGDGADLTDSMAIARWADARGGGGLFPAELFQTIQDANVLSEKLLDHERVRVTSAVLRDPQARYESMPKNWPRAARRVLLPMVWLGAWYLRAEFDFDTMELKRRMEEVEAGMAHFRSMGLRPERYCLGDRFTFADIAVASTIQAFSPVDTRFFRYPDATRRAWTWDKMSLDFSPLLEWRDWIFATKGVSP